MQMKKKINVKIIINSLIENFPLSSKSENSSHRCINETSKKKNVKNAKHIYGGGEKRINSYIMVRVSAFCLMRKSYEAR